MSIHFMGSLFRCARSLAVSIRSEGLWRKNELVYFVYITFDKSKVIVYVVATSFLLSNFVFKELYETISVPQIPVGHVWHVA